jgi:hypothetical protein
MLAAPFGRMRHKVALGADGPRGKGRKEKSGDESLN